MAVGVVSSVLVGRTDELARLRAALDRTRAGEPSVVLVGGEAGVGKSRLLDAALSGEDTVRVLTGGCIELGGDGLPFVPLVEALRTLVRTAPAADVDRWLGPARSELGRLLPELLAPGASAVAVSGSTAQLFELLLGVLGRLGEEMPLALVLEDLHWADRSTLELVAFLVRALRGIRVLLVLTYRSDEVDRRSPLRPLLTGWERLRGVERLQLERFDRAEVSAQLAGILGTTPDPALIDLVFDRSEGNAFFVEELLRAVRDGTSEALPPSLRDVLLTRAERLSPAAQRLLRTAAVAGRWVPERLLAEVAAVESAEFYDAVREAVDASLLVVDEIGRGYAFRHALTRDAVYQEFLPGERVELHVAYAHAIDRDPALAGNDTSVAATLALHWYAAHDLPRALAASVLAGRQAIAGFAPAEARQHLERALEVWRSVPDAEQRAGVDEVDVLRLAARAAYDSGDPERALPLLDRAMELLGPEPDPERIAELVERRATALRALGEDGASLEALEQALTRLPEEPPSLARAALLDSLANALFRLNTSARAPQVARTALSAARAVGARGLEASALVTLGLALCYGPDPQDGEPAIREGLQVALDAGETETALRGYVNLSDVLESRGRHRDAADTAREGMELASRVGLTRNFGAFLAGNLAEPLLRLGEWDEAEQLATETLTAGLIGVFAASLHELLGYLAVHTGRPEQALKHVREARRQLGDSREAQFVQSLIYVEAEVARAAGQLAEGIALVTGGLTESDAWLARYSWPLAWLGTRIEADIAARARDLQQPVEPRPAVGGPTTVATSVPAVAAYRAMQRAEQLRGQVDAASAWAAAVSACEQAEDAWPRAYTRYRWAEALCAAGDREAAAEPLREAHTEASRLGAAPLAEDILALARRSRLSLSDEVPGELAPVVPEPFGLTDREREVLTLVAAGRSNGQIAKELFISPKTASVHVSNILAKLGVAGRVEAAGVAHRLGLTTEISAAAPDPGQGGGAPV